MRVKSLREHPTNLALVQKLEAIKALAAFGAGLREVSSVLTPVKRLAGFRRVSVGAGQTERVRIRLERDA